MTALDTPERRARVGRLGRAALDDLGTRVVQRVYESLGSLAVPLAPHFEVRADPRLAGETDLALTFSALLAYARTGAAWDWTGAEEARDALLAVSRLYDGLLGPHSTLPEEWTDATPEGDELLEQVAEVARAALARIHLAEGSPIPRGRLAALAGVSVELVAKAVAEGVLDTTSPRPRDRGRPARDVTAESARRWLRERGVEGVS